MKKRRIIGSGILIGAVLFLVASAVFSSTSGKNTETNTSSPFKPIKVVWTGKVYQDMTYGRLVLENDDKSTKPKYFIIEPNDMIEEGALRYSPTTRYIKDTDIVKVTGTITNEEYKCWWNEPEYDGCVPWVMLESLEILDANL